MWGGPLSFDMVHTHILNMKMRRSRLKEKLKEQALKRKDREMAKEHGFNLKGTQLAPAAQVQAPPRIQKKVVGFCWSSGKGAGILLGFCRDSES